MPALRDETHVYYWRLGSYIKALHRFFREHPEYRVIHGHMTNTASIYMPIAKKYELEEILEACDCYFEKTGRRITFEYSLVHGVNDKDEDAEELIRILRHRNCHLNLIPVNPIKERNYQKPSRKSAENFKNKLEKSGINVTIRREMGSDIDGACGQLRRRHVEKK